MSCASYPVARDLPERRARSYVVSRPVGADSGEYQTPRVYHTRYYGKQGNTQEAETEVQSNGDQEVTKDDVLVWGSDHSYSDPD